MPGTSYAVIVAVEHYQHSNIRGVSFAAEDANAVRECLIHQLKVPEHNIELWVDQQATRSRLENDLPYHIRTLEADDQFIFFYAGHGFYSEATNRLTAWDTHPANLPGTTVSVDQFLLTPLRNSACRKSLVFIDACASSFGDERTRNFLQEMDREDFERFVKSQDYSAAYFSCAPGQQSYHWDELRHGIWTYHLLKALRGEDEKAFERDRLITGQSLQTYLKHSVPAFITKNTDIKAEQRPYSVVSAEGMFEIADIANCTTAAQKAEEPQPAPSPPSSLPDRVMVANDYLRERDHAPITEIMKKIWALPRVHILVRPGEFRKGRFKSLEHCEQFLAAQHVPIQNGRWSRYPLISGGVIEYGTTCVCGEADIDDPPVLHTERCVLFQSGQFAHNLALDRVEPLGKRIHVLELLEIVTGLYEFTARMVEQSIITEEAGIRIELYGVAGRELTWREQDNLNGWSQADTIAFEKVYSPPELRGGRRELALDAALGLYAHFGWTNPPRRELAAAQEQRFGPGAPKPEPTTFAVGQALIRPHGSLPTFDTSVRSLTFPWGKDVTLSIDWLRQDVAMGLTCVFVNERAESMEEFSVEVTEAMFWSAKHERFLENEFKPRYIHQGQKIGPDSRTDSEWLVRIVKDTGGRRLTVGNDDGSRLMKPNNNLSKEEVWRLTLVPCFKLPGREQVRLSNAHLYIRLDRDHDDLQIAKESEA